MDINQVLPFLSGNTKGIKVQAQVSNSPLAFVLMLSLPDHVCVCVSILTCFYTHSQFPTGVYIRLIVIDFFSRKCDAISRICLKLTRFSRCAIISMFLVNYP